jgi:hypothetical protein
MHVNRHREQDRCNPKPTSRTLASQVAGRAAATDFTTPRKNQRALVLRLLWL